MLKRNIILEGQIKSWLGRANTEDMNLYEKGLLINAVRGLYNATDDEDYKTWVLNVLDNSISEDGTVSGTEDSEDVDDMYFGNQIFFAVDEDEKYKKAILNIEKSLAGVDGTMSYEDTYKCQPFFMNYETIYGGKERYNAIIANYNRVVKEAGEAQASAEFACGLIDTMEVMAQPLYEIYAKMKDYFKDTVKACINGNIGCEKDVCAEKMLCVYAILKGCRMKALHTEKYEKAQLAVLDAAINAVCLSKTAIDADTVDGAALVLAYAESLRNREYQDYGRNKGGVLWS